MDVRIMAGLAAGTGLIGAACLACSQYERGALSVEETWICSEKLKGDKTLVFLSDLHDNRFGPGNRELLRAIREAGPDLVLVGGDMMVSKGKGDVSVALELMGRLAADYPVCYGNGNHESRMTWERETYGRRYEAYKKQLEGWGVFYLENDTARFGTDLAVTGLDLERRFYKKAFLKKPEPMEKDYICRAVGKADAGRFQILLAHSPLYFKEYAGWGADLTLSGHFHGGTIRLPGLGGVMTPQYQFFLPWCAGEFEREGRRMIVSRGLGTHSINIRLNNRPQLVVIRLKKR